MSAKKRGLGMGLEALFDASSIEVAGGGPMMVPLSSVEPRPDQPRKDFDGEALASLAESISRHGVLQPLLVRRAGEGYRIIAGERRWRAARLAGLDEVPVLVKDIDEAGTFEVALIENLQREDLSPMELSNGYRALMERFGLTQDEVAQRIGRSRSAVANTLRLATLPGEVIALLEEGRLSEGQARTLVGLPEQQALELAAKAGDGGLTVRQLEAAVKQLGRPEKPEKPQKPADDGIYAKRLETRLGRELGRKVRLGPKRLVIEYYGNDDLAALLGRLGLPEED